LKNIAQMMKQAQQMQARMAEMQEQLATAEVTGRSGGGVVEVTLNGKGEMRRVRIDPSLLTGDVGIIEDLVVAAHNDAKAKVEEHVAEEMKKVTGGIELPAGIKLPF
jgi:DNA-binding YbaB/EbfC family protein